MPSYIPKPGIALGLYPEHHGNTSNKLVKGKKKSLIRANTKSYHKKSVLKKIVAKINQEGELLKPLELPFIKQKLDDVRFDMIRQGLNETCLIKSFAIIREMSFRILGMRHHDVQVMGAWVMINDMLVEMDTGEGKTLTATLVVGTAALAGIPTHVMTVNAYLAQRDAASMTPLYHELGLTIGIATDLETDDERRLAYKQDITYCTSKQIAFDYLRDRMILKDENTRLHHQLAQLPQEFGQTKNLFLRGLCFAVVDEADSVLADEALNPLVIANEQSIPEQEKIYHQAISIVDNLILNDDFVIDKKRFQVSITSSGEQKIENISCSFSGVWKGKQRRKHLCELGLSALYLYEKDRHYLVEDNKVVIIDQNTGRTMGDRSWEHGLHQLIESKEGCPITGQRNTLAKLTFQRFFRRYLKLTGMSGTIIELEKELQSTYGLKVVRIPSHKPNCRVTYPAWVFTKDQYKWTACVRRVRQLHKQGRPILIGTRTVLESEHLSDLLSEYALPHQVLTAKNTQNEAEIVAQAGEFGSIVVATNVAGRGTDIKLDDKAKEIGGLHVMVVEHNDAKRIDRQLFGRCARQGDPGSYEMLLSLESSIVQQYYTKWFLKWVFSFASRFGLLPQWAGIKIIRLPQLMIERRQRSMRNALLKADEQLGKLLSFTGRQE